MPFDRRAFLTGLAAAQARLAGQDRQLGIPGPYPGRVVAVEHPASILDGVYQREPVGEMMRRGMMELTGAPSWQDAWRVFFEPGDVVIIKVNPVGQPYIVSAPEVFQEIVAGLEAAGVKRGDIFAYDRYQTEFLSGGFQKWLPDGVRWSCATVKYDKLQLDMDGYDRDQYIELPLLGRGHDHRDPHHRRSYVAKLLSRTANKVVNLGVLKHHQSAGITIALKNLSHGFVNNVARSHVSRTDNACGMFIPAVVDHRIFRQKVVLNIIDGIKGAYHGGPARRTAKYLWEHKTLYFGTDPVALDRTGWNVLDMKRGQMGMQPIALAPDDQDSNFIRMQPEHVELASMLGLGVADEDKIDLRRIKLG